MNRAVEITTGQTRYLKVKRRSPQVSGGQSSSEQVSTGQEDVTIGQWRSPQVRGGLHRSEETSTGQKRSPKVRGVSPKVREGQQIRGGRQHVREGLHGPGEATRG